MVRALLIDYHFYRCCYLLILLALLSSILFNHHHYSQLHDYCNTHYNVRILANITSTQSTSPRSLEPGAGLKLSGPDLYLARSVLPYVLHSILHTKGPSVPASAWLTNAQHQVHNPSRLSGIHPNGDAEPLNLVECDTTLLDNWVSLGCCCWRKIRSSHEPTGSFVELVGD